MSSEGSRRATFRIASVNAERMKTLGVLVGDSNPIHLYPEAAAAAGLGDRVVNPGSANLGYVINALNALGPGARLERLSVVFSGNVLAGDEVVASAELIQEGDEGERRRVRSAIALDVVGGGRAIEGTAVVSLPRE